MARDYKDLCIEILADAEAALLEDLAHVAAESDSRLVLAQIAIQAYVEEKRQHVSTREQLNQVRDEYRYLRQQLLREGAHV